jgi:hypothetical protein
VGKVEKNNDITTIMNEVLQKILTDKNARSEDKVDVSIITQNNFETWE